MYDPDTDNPYSQSSLPYQAYNRGCADASGYQQQAYGTYATAARARPRMSKAQALECVGKCKRWLVAGSIVAFGILGGLVAGHAVGTTSDSKQAAPANPPATSPTTPATPASPASGGGFFQQGGGSNFGNSNPGQPPVSGSSSS